MPHRRKIGVLTFHRCINYGSYWQARCLTEGLRAQGWDAVLLDHRSPRVDRAEWACALRPSRPARTPRRDIRAYAAKARRFMTAVERLPLSSPFSLEAPTSIEPCDITVVGSDEVWNFSHPWYAACPLFFGEGLRGDRLVAYAASFGNYDAAAGLGGRWAERLARFDAIAVRDDNSRRILREGLGADAALVLDPCLLFDGLCRATPSRDLGRDVVVYGHSFSAAFGRAAREWADGAGARLVSLGYHNAWADEQRLTAGPLEFAQAMADARAVVTNFFHGCVFALVHRKPFACAVSDYRAIKVTALLGALGAEDRLVSADASAEALGRSFTSPPEAGVEDRLSELRRGSQAYLERALA